MTWLLTVAWPALRKVPGWAWAVLAAVGALVLAYLRGEKAGRASERQEATEEALEHKREADELRHEVESLTSDELDQRGEPWVRR